LKRVLNAVLLVLIIGLAASFVACGDSDSADTDTDTEPVVVEPTKVMVEEISATPVSASKFGGTLRVVSQASISSLDPAWGGAYVITAVSSHIYETLFGWDANIQDKPIMVDTWNTSDDGLTWSFTLREDRKFHDGTTVTADDVRSTFQRWLQSWYSIAGLMREFEDENSFVVTGDYSFDIVLNEPTGAVIMSLAKPYGSPRIMPSRIDDGVDSTEQIEAEWVGSGAYKFLSWSQGDRVTLERYDEYSSRDEEASLYTGEQVAFIDQLVWLEIPDEETKIAGLETGEWDVVDGAGLDFYDRVNSNSDLNVPTYKPGHRSNLLIPNNPPFGEGGSKARMALQTGLDIANVMASLGPKELWTLCPAVFYCGTRWETDAGAAEYYNLNDKVKARELLAESGYDGETLILLNPTDYSTITPTGLVVKQEMKEMGFNVDMPALDWATIVTRFGNTESFALATSWDVHWNSTSPLEHEAIGASAAIFPPAIPKLHDLRKQFAQASSEKEKLRIVEEMQIEFYRNAPAVYEGVFYSLFPATSELKNFEVKAFPHYANTWLERR